MTDFAKLRNTLIGISFLALGACTEQGPDRVLWQSMGDVFKTTPKPETVDAPDPGDTPYPNLGAIERRPARPDAKMVANEQADLAVQRDAAQRFDAQLREIDPILDPASRPPEPVAIAAGTQVVAVPVPAAPAAQIAPPLPVLPLPPPPSQAPLAPVQTVPSVAAVPLAQTPPPAQTLPAFVPPVLAPTTVPPLRPVPAPPTAPVRATAATAWLIGEIGFADGSTLLTADVRRVLRQAVAAAQERGGTVRLTPMASGAASPQDQALGPRRMAASAGELESLGLDRSRVLIDQGAFRQVRVTVEF